MKLLIFTPIYLLVLTQYFWPVFLDLFTLQPLLDLQPLIVFVEHLALDFLMPPDLLFTQYLAPVFFDLFTLQAEEVRHDLRVFIEHLADFLPDLPFLPDFTQYLAPDFLDRFTRQLAEVRHFFKLFFEHFAFAMF